MSYEVIPYHYEKQEQSVLIELSQQAHPGHLTFPRAHTRAISTPLFPAPSQPFR